MPPINIPAITPYSSGATQGSYISSQPIMQFKDLEVDMVRYDAYKAMIENAKARKKRKP